MRLVFDTETSGLPPPGVPLSDPSQPRICQLAAGVFDARWKRVQHFSTLIKPDGWTMQIDAQRKHGISEERCSRYGIPIVVALSLFQAFCASAVRIYGHNIEFDRNMITRELFALSAEGLWWRKRAGAFVCTMKTSTDLMQLPGKFGFKDPSLEELFRFLFPARDFEAEHEAEHDYMVTADIARELERLEMIPPMQARPAVLDRQWGKPK